MSSDDKRDSELDSLLVGLKSEVPTDLQMQKWKNAVRGMPNKKGLKWGLQMATAVLVGILIGTFVQPQNLRETQISFNDATFELSHDNLDQ